MLHGSYGNLPEGAYKCTLSDLRWRCSSTFICIYRTKHP